MSWPVKQLGDVLLRTESVDPRSLGRSKFRYIDVSSVSNETLSIEEVQTLAVNDAPSRARRFVRNGDVLFATIRPTLRRIAIVPEELDGQVCSTGYFVLRPRHEASNRFLFYFLQSNEFMASMKALQKGASYPAVTDAEVRMQKLPLPPVAEQLRIVVLLDQAFAGIAAAKANAAKSLRNTRKVLEFGFDRVFGDVANLRMLGTVCSFENGDRGKNYPGKQHRVSSGVPFINAGHLTNDGIDFSEMDYISGDRFALLGNGKIRAGDILFCLRGSLGKFAGVGDLNEGAIASSLVILRPRSDLSSDYLQAFLASRQCREQIERFKGGAAQPNLGAKDLKKFKLPVPSVDQQEFAVAELDALRSNVSHIQSLYTRKLAALDELKQSLLHQAFSGQLS